LGGGGAGRPPPPLPPPPPSPRQSGVATVPHSSLGETQGERERERERERKRENEPEADRRGRDGRTGAMAAAAPPAKTVSSNAPVVVPDDPKDPCPPGRKRWMLWRSLFEIDERYTPIKAVGEPRGRGGSGGGGGGPGAGTWARARFQTVSSISRCDFRNQMICSLYSAREDGSSEVRS